MHSFSARRMISKRTRLRQPETLEPRQLLAADVIINEFMAANQQTINDGFGASSDWIELRNMGTEEADLTGLFLTDDPDNLNKWPIPAGTRLGANEVLLVFASGFDTADPGGNLHTNFQLSAAGGYLALTTADFSVLSQFDSGNYSAQFADISYGLHDDPQTNETVTGFLTQPTPGALNSGDVANVGPLIRDVTDKPGGIDTSAELRITTRVTPRYAPIAAVDLVYRAMYGDEFTLRMRDDGLAGDQVAGDGQFSAVIPAHTAAPGEMIRWRVVARDDAGRESREPPFLDTAGTDQSPQYLGTVTHDPNVTSPLPILQWFLEPGTERRADTARGTRASVFYGGEFYDNVFVRVRGGSSANQPKKSYKIDFNTGHDFRFAADAGRVREINLNTTYTNKDYIRQALAFETYDAAGLPASEAFPVRVERNNEFYSVAILIEQPDADLLDREGLDANGALYKMFNTFTSGTANVEKKTREFEDHSDLVDFIAQINSLEGDQLRNYVFDNVDIPAVLNYLAATVIIQNNDQMAKNYFLYRDTNGTGQWRFLPWDLDLVLGLHFMSNDSILDDTIWADKDGFRTFAGVTIWPSHPFVGDEAHPGNRSWNRLIDALYEVPEFREMYLRRLRSLMDQLLQPPGTAAEELWFETRLDEYAELLADDVALDYQTWANPWPWGNDESFADSLRRIKDEYLAVRRRHLYETHSVDNLKPDEITVLIPQFSQARYFVPVDDALGTAWTQPAFDDSSWQMGETGLGFENTPRNFADLIRTRVKPAEVSAESTSLLVRVPFNIDDLSWIDDLTLRLKYDDGFVAYLNGVEVSRANLRTDGPQSFDSRALSRPSADALEFENIPLSHHVDKLVQGQNVLAIHVLNSSPSNSDLLLVPELVEGVIRTTDIAGIPHAQPADVSLEFGSAIEFDPASGNQDEEFFTIENPNDFAIDISGWTVSGSAHTEFAAGTVIRGGTALYVAADVLAFRGRPSGPAGSQGLFIQPFDGHLSNAGDTLRLFDRTGREVSSLSYVGHAGLPQQNLRITEINYNPHGPLTQFGELETDNDSFEFIEIRNVGSETVELAGTRLLEVSVSGNMNGVAYTFGAGQLAAGENILVVKSRSAFVSRFGDQPQIAGEFQGKLSNGGERLTLVDAAGDTIQQFRYNDAGQWPALADGGGASLELIDPSGDSGDGLNWRASREIGGTPGRATVVAPPGIVINEILTRTSPPAVDQLELFNAGSQPIDVAGWYISDGNNLTRYQIPGDSQVIEPGAYLLFDERQLGFGFKGQEPDDARLVRSAADGRPVAFADYVQFGAADEGVSFGRWPNGSGVLQAMRTPTLGAANSGPAGGGLMGDLDRDADVDADDIDRLCAAIRASEPIDGGDLNADGIVDLSDAAELVQGILGTTAGDANLDGVFNSSDLVLVFQAGQYEDQMLENSRWATGDWNCDGEFTTSDLVAAFQTDRYLAV